ncbi:histidine phosphatase family protein [Galbibacter sp. BG1]|uniref:SixA phosphatase family protein n=1 Tax=Galbibacter sp. BG1 TaxID=1170699 RepID=UPI0015C17E3B|nr:phosphoglycerate mutase family protein [Galbibacter sp. BG1]QLE03022.1 histidine phosphatase family protein [Galbibacter sp. BG1]
MKKIFLLVTLTLLMINCDTPKPEVKSEVTTLYFIRHAEKNRENPEDRDPALTEKGMIRAKKWSEILKNVTFDAVYSTAYTRTVETATPTAYKNNLDIIKYEPENLNTLEIFKNGYDNVLVVGHSNTVPKLVNKLIGEDHYEDIEDTNNGNLYIVTLENQDVISVNLLTIN